MESYEFEGKNTEDAIANACRQLSLSRSDMEIEVLEPGSAGIFGLVGGRKARIKVTLPAPTPEPELTAEPHPEEAVPEEPAGDRVAASYEDQRELEVAKKSLEKILELIPMEEISVSAAHANGAITLNMEGDKTGLLIGRKGRTLDALQFIVNKIVNKTLERRVQVVLDSENYRERRREALTQMALRMGEKVKRLKKPVSTNPLNPYDRRIVHLSLRDDVELDTKSRGEGMLKKIIIMPRRSGGQGRSPHLQ